jgi:hypothetical protein
VYIIVLLFSVLPLPCNHYWLTLLKHCDLCQRALKFEVHLDGHCEVILWATAGSVRKLTGSLYDLYDLIGEPCVSPAKQTCAVGVWW